MNITPLPNIHWKGQMKFILLDRVGHWGLFKQEFYPDGKNNKPKGVWFCVIKIIVQNPIKIDKATVNFECKENTIGSSAGGLAYWTFTEEGCSSVEGGPSGLEMARAKFNYIVKKSKER